jgi:ubiquinone/menaquinone biosynthesis C-methylase UbiE
MKREYDDVAGTYSKWTDRMNKYTDEILRIDVLEKNKATKVLDFACGTGYITKKILSENSNPELRITAIDISEKMLEKAQTEINDPRSEFILHDGLSFLKKQEDCEYDAIYCGYALPYFNRRKISKQFNRVLKPGGTLHLITNCRGTLKGIFEIYREIMKRDLSQINKIMEVGLNLPGSEKSLNAMFSKYKFDIIISKTVNEWITFDTPKKLYRWLKETGAIAGTGKVFINEEEYEEDIINKIE